MAKFSQVVINGGGNVSSGRGAMYMPQKDWNAYQMWENYDQSIIERDVGYASALGLNTLRVLGSYERWREDGPSYFARTHHFLNVCDQNGIEPLIILFEAPPENRPTRENLLTTDPGKAFGVHSPDRMTVIQPQQWSGYSRSPLHFSRRFAEEFGDDNRLLAIEIMNEPGEVEPRRSFVVDMTNEVREHAPGAAITMGCKDFRFNSMYDNLTNDALDIHQFHMNLPGDPEHANQILDQAKLHRELSGKPLLCTEWQRTMEEPPSRFMPNTKSLAPTVYNAIDEGWIDGAYVWGLMLKPAYLRTPRERGRYNGLLHPDGTAFDLGDVRAVAQSSNVPFGERHRIPDSWLDHPFPYPVPEGQQTGGNVEQGMSEAILGGALVLGAALALNRYEGRYTAG